MKNEKTFKELFNIFIGRFNIVIKKEKVEKEYIKVKILEPLKMDYIKTKNILCLNEKCLHYKNGNCRFVSINLESFIPKVVVKKYSVWFPSHYGKMYQVIQCETYTHELNYEFFK